jgi:hypothetical protein
MASEIQRVRAIDFVRITGGAERLYIGGFSRTKRQKTDQINLYGSMGFDLGEDDFVRNSFWRKEKEKDGRRWADVGRFDWTSLANQCDIVVDVTHKRTREQTRTISTHASCYRGR